jgi:DNA invertase Pin-like site-specific DNA recombinase
MTSPAYLNSDTVRELMKAWVAASSARLAEPNTLDGKTLNRMGELIMSAANWVAAQERKARQEAIRSGGRQ